MGQSHRKPSLSGVECHKCEKHCPSDKKRPGVCSKGEAFVLLRRRRRVRRGLGRRGGTALCDGAPVGVDGAVRGELGAGRDAVTVQLVGVPALEGVAAHDGAGQGGELAVEVGAGDDGDAGAATRLKIDEIGFAAAIRIGRQCQRKQEQRHQQQTDNF